MTQVATSAADSYKSDVIAERLITVSMAAMTAFCLLRQGNLESEPNERGQCAAESKRHCDHSRLHDSLGDFALADLLVDENFRVVRAALVPVGAV